MIAAKPSRVMEDVDKECGCFPWEGFLGYQFLLAYGALNEMPLTALPCAFRGRKVDPGFRYPVPSGERRSRNSTGWIDHWFAKAGERRSTLDHAVGELADFDRVTPSVTMGVDHPWTDAE